MIIITLVETKNHRFRLSSSFFSYFDLTTFQVKNILSNMFCDEKIRHLPFKKIKTLKIKEKAGVVFFNDKEN